MCNKYVEFCVKNIKSLLVIGTISVSCIVFLAQLAPRMNTCEAKYAELESRIIADERKFEMTSTKLETSLAQIQSDLQLIKNKLLYGGK